MGKGRTQMTLDELVKKYTTMKLKKKQRKPDKYAGLQECGILACAFYDDKIAYLIDLNILLKKYLENVKPEKV